MLGSTLLVFLDIKKAACRWKAWTCVHFNRLHPSLAVTSLRLRHLICETTFIIGFWWRVLTSCCKVFKQRWALSKGSKKYTGHYYQDHIGFLLVGPDEARSILYLPTPPTLRKNKNKTLVMLPATDSLQINRHMQIESNRMEKDSSWKWKRKKRARVAIFTANHIDFKIKAIRSDKEGPSKSTAVFIQRNTRHCIEKT